MFQQARDIHTYITYNKEVNCECDFSLACKLEAKNGIIMYVTIIDVNFFFSSVAFGGMCLHWANSIDLTCQLHLAYGL
jgi:hypothetical protein